MKFARTDTAIAVVFAAIPLTAYGQAAPPAASPDSVATANSSSQVTDIVVTAQRRSQKVDDVPIAITAISGAMLGARNVSNLSDLVAVTPNMSTSNGGQGGGALNFYIRGIGQFDFISTNDPGVGVYLNGVYIARSAGALLDLVDIDRIEVLRGPQGTLFGKNAVGGAVSVYTTQPEANQFSGQAIARLGENGRRDLGGAINVPLVTDKLALRVSGMSEYQDGYAKSLADGTHMNNTDRQVINGTLRWTPAANFSAELGADYTHVNEEGSIATIGAINTDTFVSTPQNAYALANGLTPYDQRYLSSGYTNYSTYHPGDHENIWGTRLNLTWDTGPVTLKSITAYRKLISNTGLDYDGSPTALGNQSVHDYENQFTQEVTASGKFLNDKLDLVTGMFFMRENGTSAIDLTLSYTDNPEGYDSYITNNYANTTVAGFGQATYKVTNRLSLTAGGRYSYERKTDLIAADQPKNGGYTLPGTSEEDSWNSFTWRLAAQYDLTPTTMAYASASTGFKSGGFNGRAKKAGVFLAFAPEKALTYEVGLKTRLLQDHVALRAALFSTNYRNIQTTLNTTDDAGDIVNVIANPADALIQGAELEGEAHLDRHFSINFGGGYLRSHFKNIESGADITYADNLPNAPKWTGNAGAQYQFNAPVSPIRDGKITARMDWAYKSSYYFNAQNSIYNRQAPYSLFNSKLTYSSALGGWSVAFYGKNIFNKLYYTHREDLYAYVYAINLPAPPRELGVELRKSF